MNDSAVAQPGEERSAQPPVSRLVPAGVQQAEGAAPQPVLVGRAHKTVSSAAIRSRVAASRSRIQRQAVRSLLFPVRQPGVPAAPLAVMPPGPRRSRPR